MKKHLIKLPDVISEEFVKALQTGEVLVHGIGTFYVTEYKKKSHILLVSKGEYSSKARKMVKICFTPDVDLKMAIRKG